MNYKAPDNSLHFIEPEYAHLLPAGSVPVTDEEAEAIRIANTPVPAPPTPLEQIRVLEARYSDTQAKVTRQALLTLALKEAMQYPEANGLAAPEVHTILMTKDNGYKALFELEQQVEVLRRQPA